MDVMNPRADAPAPACAAVPCFLTHHRRSTARGLVEPAPAPTDVGHESAAAVWREWMSKELLGREGKEADWREGKDGPRRIPPTPVRPAPGGGGSQADARSS